MGSRVKSSSYPVRKQLIFNEFIEFFILQEMKKKSVYITNVGIKYIQERKNER